jgi:nucleoside-diphosphate-sugar epimerase
VNVLAIGATGFIGSHVVRLLAEKGHNVAIVHRGTKSPVIPGVRHIHGNRDALVDLQQEFVRFKPDVALDVILHTERNAQELVTTFRGVATRVVILSSEDVYRNYDGLRGRSSAPPDRMPLREDAPLRERLFPHRGHAQPHEWAHDYEKILVERVVLADPELPGTVLRLPAVYGPGDRQRRVGQYLDRMSNESRISLTTEQSVWRWTRGYVENVAHAIALAVADNRSAGRVYNVGEPALTERQWIEAIGKASGWAGEVVVGEGGVAETPGESLDYRYELMVDTSRIREELGYSEPVSLEEALRRTVAWEATIQKTGWK